MNLQNPITDGKGLEPASAPQAFETSRDPQAWNPRYLAYCKAHGAANPEEMLARDAEEWPGGKMAGFTIWISQQWGAWCKANGVGRYEPKTEADHLSFDRFVGAA